MRTYRRIQKTRKIKKPIFNKRFLIICPVPVTNYSLGLTTFPTGSSSGDSDAINQWAVTGEEAVVKSEPPVDVGVIQENPTGDGTPTNEDIPTNEGAVEGMGETAGASPDDAVAAEAAQGEAAPNGNPKKKWHEKMAEKVAFNLG